MLHTNLVYLATIADSNQNMQSLLPAVSMEWCKTEGGDFIWATGVGKKVFKVLYSEYKLQCLFVPCFESDVLTASVKLTI